MAINPHPTKGKGWWQIRISHGRGKKQENITYQGSRAQAIAFEGDLRGLPAELQHQKPTDVLGRFLDWYSIHRAANSLIYAENALPKIINRLGNKNLITYTQADYTRYKQIRAGDGVTKRTTNIELLIWRSMLTFATKHLGVSVSDPPELYPRKQTRPPDKNPLTADETARLIDNLTGDKQTIVMLYAYCGLRRNEALNLTKSMVDLDRGMLQIRGKGDKPRLVPIIGTTLLEQLRQKCKNKGRGELLFISPHSQPDKPQPYKNIKKAIKSAGIRAGIDKPIYNHLLRHSAATNAVVAGVNIRALQTILGHSDIRTTELYTHMAADILKTEAIKMATLHTQATSKNNPAAMSAINTTKKHK